MDTDARGNSYFDFNDTRFTLVLQRDPETDWSGRPVLRVQKYKDRPASDALHHRGPEIEIGSRETLIDLSDLIQQLADLYPDE